MVGQFEFPNGVKHVMRRSLCLVLALVKDLLGRRKHFVPCPSVPTKLAEKEQQNNVVPEYREPNQLRHVYKTRDVPKSQMSQSSGVNEANDQHTSNVPKSQMSQS